MAADSVSIFLKNLSNKGWRNYGAVPPMLQGETLKIKNLGDLVAPVVVFGGPYSNLHALQAMQARCEAMGISSQNIICTGDAAAYCAHPEECIQFLRDWGIHVLAGNCEINLSHWNSPLSNIARASKNERKEVWQLPGVSQYCNHLGGRLSNFSQCL